MRVCMLGVCVCGCERGCKWWMYMCVHSFCIQIDISYFLVITSIPILRIPRGIIKKYMHSFKPYRVITDNHKVYDYPTPCYKSMYSLSVCLYFYISYKQRARCCTAVPAYRVEYHQALTISSRDTQRARPVSDSQNR